MICSRRGGWSLTALFALFAVGCGSPYQVAPVSGVLLVEGKPYPGGKIVFAPVAKDESGKAGRAAIGIPDAEGRFTLGTYSDDDGAVVGEHVVTFFRAADDSATRPDMANLKFKRVSLPSGRVTVVPGDNQVEVAFTLDEIKQYGNRL